MTDLAPLEMNSRPLAMSRLTRFPPAVSELTFTNLFVWRKSRPAWLVESRETLLFVVAPEPESPARFVMGAPVGPPLTAAEVKAAVPGFRGYIRVPEPAAGQLERDGLLLERDDDNADYVYCVKDLAELKGEKYQKKRNLVRRCLRNYECRYEPITPALVPECMAMQTLWCQARDCGRDPGLCHEFDAIRELFIHFETLQLLGGAVRVNGTVQAFAVGEALAPGTAVCHFEKAMPAVQGLGQVINQWFAAEALRDFEFLNREQDLGLPGLRQAKLSYRPHHRVVKYHARLPEEAGSGRLAPEADPRVCDRQTAPGEGAAA